MTAHDLIIANARLRRGTGQPLAGDVRTIGITDGRIVMITEAPLEGLEYTDADGALVLPSCVNAELPLDKIHAWQRTLGAARAACAGAGMGVGHSFTDAPWVRNVIGERSLLFPWGAPAFDLGFFVAVLAAYLASMIESFGDYHAVTRVSGLGEPTRRQIDRGIGSEGLSCFVTGLLGGFASTSYTENTGLIGLTRVASRYVVLLGAIGLIVLRFVTKFGAIIAPIPSPIVGGVYVALFGLIAAVGLTNLLRADMSSQRSVLIAGFILFIGLVVLDFVYQLSQDWTFLGMSWTTSLAWSIFGGGIAVAAILGLFLDNVIPGTVEERGIRRSHDPLTDPVRVR